MTTKAMHAEIGDVVRFSKTVTESDVYLYAGITGDFSGNHVNEKFMSKSIYRHRIAHGALMVGFMSTTSTLMIEESLKRGVDSTPVSLGYDKVRFLAPVFFGDTVEVTYTIVEIDVDRRRSLGKVEVHNQDGTLVAVAQHLTKWVQNEVVESAAA